MAESARCQSDEGDEIGEMSMSTQAKFLRVLIGVFLPTRSNGCPSVHPEPGLAHDSPSMAWTVGAVSGPVPLALHGVFRNSSTQ